MASVVPIYGVQDFQYHILNPRNLFCENVGFQNKVFNFWSNFWTEIYTSAGSPESFKVDDFFRQDQICCISYKEEIVALHLYTHFNTLLDQCTAHSYFQFYSDNFMNDLRHRGANRIMSMEFFTVNPAFRSSITGISFGRVLLSLGLKVFEASSSQAAIGPARTDVNAHKMSYEVGFECIEGDTMQRNFPCDLVACF